MDYRDWEITAHHRAIEKVIAKIPDDASVSALNHIVPHVAERHEVYLFNDNVDKVDCIHYDFYAEETRMITRSTFQLPSLWPDNEAIRAVLRNRNYGIIDYEDGVCLWEKGADYDAGLEKLGWSIGAEISEPLYAQINDKIFFKGHRLHPVRKSCTNLGAWEKPNYKEMIHFTCFWTTEERCQENYLFTFKISDRNSEYYIHHTPVFGVYPSQLWIENEIIRDEVFWEIPEDMEKGNYTVSVALQPSATDGDKVEETGARDSEEKDFITLFSLDFEE